MAKDFLKLAKSRKTTYEFSSRKVNDSQLRKILEAARWAPSCSNSQPWHFIIVNDKKAVEKLVRIANYGDFHGIPPIIIAAVLREDLCSGPGKVCFRGVKSSVNDSYMSVGMACIQMSLEAASIGLSTCILTPDYAQAGKILKLKKGDECLLMLGVGYEKKGAYQKERTRNKLSDIISYNHFGGKKP